MEATIASLRPPACDWIYQNMPVTRRVADLLLPSDLSHVRLALSAHLEPKMLPAFEPMMRRGAGLFLTTCNPTTVRDEFVGYCGKLGAQTHAWLNMTANDQAEAARRAIAWGPTHLCEMGADLSAVILENGLVSSVRASLEATGSGISRLRAIEARGNKTTYPIFNWDDLPIKEGLHNRHMVGFSTWHAFCERTQLSLHAHNVLVVGFGLVGQGVAAQDRAFGATVSVAERDPARLLEARYAGFSAANLDDATALRQFDIVVTATGARHVLQARHFNQLKRGAFLLNVGHVAEEIDIAELGRREPVIPFVERVYFGDNEFYLFAGGSIAHLTAGYGDSLNAFDITLATMLAGLAFIFDPVRVAHCAPG